jgi:hypothetical protein
MRWVLECEDGTWMEVSQDHVQWRASIFAVFNLCVLLTQCYLLTYLLTHSLTQSMVQDIL